MTGHGTVSVTYQCTPAPADSVRHGLGIPQFHKLKPIFLLNCSKRCAAKEVVQLQGHTWRLRLQAAY